jgi:hypothetical protein
MFEENISACDSRNGCGVRRFEWIIVPFTVSAITLMISAKIGPTFQ